MIIFIFIVLLAISGIAVLFVFSPLLKITIDKFFIDYDRKLIEILLTPIFVALIAILISPILLMSLVFFAMGLDVKSAYKGSSAPRIFASDFSIPAGVLLASLAIRFGATFMHLR